MKASKLSKDIIREFNTLTRNTPIVLNHCEPKYVSYGGTWGNSYTTFGVQATIIRIYSQYKKNYNFTFGTYFEKGQEIIKVSTQETNDDYRNMGSDRSEYNYKQTPRKIESLGEYTVLEFHELFKALMKQLRDNTENQNIDFYIDFFRSANSK
jgi:hypothetical protein